MPRGFQPRLEVKGGAELGRISAALKAEGNKGLQKQMRKRLREAVKPVADDIKRDAAQQSKQVAKSITTSFSYSSKRAGAKISARRSKMPPGKEGLPGLLEFGNRGRRGILRHPVFADKDESRRSWTWAEQPVRPYFFKNAKQNNKAVTDAMVQVLADVDRELRGNK
jgi:hypothetical protein